ncbi:MAG TPA: DEAD/DEAH box helicase, partial [Dehalococcoidia bacterium]|nr:DEAD/DEAH box helicase [Dehalococcoidia bacterium]
MSKDLFIELKRVLDLEQRQEYRDRAAIGGLSSYFGHWRRRGGDDLAGTLPAGELAALAGALGSYSAAGAAERALALKTARALIDARLANGDGARDAGSAAVSPTPTAVPGSADRLARQGAPATGRREGGVASPRPDHSTGPAPSGAQASRPPRSDPSHLHVASAQTSPPESGRAAPLPRRRADTSGPRGRGAGSAPLTPDQPVMAVPGVSKPTAAKLARLGIEAVEDLLYLVPRRYLDFSRRVRVAELRPGVEQTVFATVWESRVRPFGARLSGTEVTLSDETGTIQAVWFGNRYLAKQLPVGSRVAISGRPTAFKGRLTFQSPEYELLEGDDLIHTGGLVPVHPATEGLTPRMLRKVIRAALPAAAHLTDPLPIDTRRRHGLIDLAEAIEQIHVPIAAPAVEEARHRLAFDELLVLQLAVLARRRAWVGGPAAEPITWPAGERDRILAALPFDLTGAQRRALDAILGDLGRPIPMSRLLQGDVGSGKTVVAAVALFLANRAGFQGALMVPTEILAEQHYAVLSEILEPLGVRVHRLVGSVRAKGKKLIK